MSPQLFMRFRVQACKDFQRSWVLKVLSDLDRFFQACKSFKLFRAFYNSSATQKDLRDATTLPMHPPPGMGFAPPSPCPWLGTTGSSPPIGAPQGRMTSDEVRKYRSPLPKLVVKGGNATTLTRVISDSIIMSGSKRQPPVSILGRNQQLLSRLRWLERHDNDTIGGYLFHPIRRQCTLDHQLQVRPYHSIYPCSRPQCELSWWVVSYQKGSKPHLCKKALPLYWTCCSSRSRPTCHQSRVLEWRDWLLSRPHLEHPKRHWQHRGHGGSRS